MLSRTLTTSVIYGLLLVLVLLLFYYLHKYIYDTNALNEPELTILDEMITLEMMDIAMVIVYLAPPLYSVSKLIVSLIQSENTTAVNERPKGYRKCKDNLEELLAFEESQLNQLDTYYENIVKLKGNLLQLKEEALAENLPKQMQKFEKDIQFFKSEVNRRAMQVDGLRKKFQPAHPKMKEEYQKQSKLFQEDYDFVQNLEMDVQKLEELCRSLGERIEKCKTLMRELIEGRNRLIKAAEDNKYEVDNQVADMKRDFESSMESKYSKLVNDFQDMFFNMTKTCEDHLDSIKSIATVVASDSRKFENVLEKAQQLNNDVNEFEKAQEETIRKMDKLSDSIHKDFMDKLKDLVRTINEMEKTSANCTLSV